MRFTPPWPANSGNRRSAADEIFYAGRRVPLGAMTPDHVDVRGGAMALANIGRFHGNTAIGPYSVAQHCLLVSEIAGHIARDMACDDRQRLARLWGLLHDWHECILGDIASPLKRRIRRETDIIDALAADTDRALCAAIGLTWPLPSWLLDVVHRADAIAYVTEVRDVTDGLTVESGSPEPWPRRVKVLPWHMAAEQWMREWQSLTGPTGRA